MLQKKKDEMKKRRRRRRDIDIINDNDDLIDDLIRRMMEAAEVCTVSCAHMALWKYSVHLESYQSGYKFLDLSLNLNPFTADPVNALHFAILV